MKNRFEIKREESIRAILDASLDLFSEIGFEKTTIRKIADNAGISLGLLYNYFESKEEVLKAIILDAKHHILGSFQHKVIPEKAIDTYLQVIVTQLKQNKKFYKVFYGIRLQSSLLKELGADLNLHPESIQPQLEQVFINSGIPFPGLEAKLFFATVDGIIQHFLLKDNYPIEDVVNMLKLKYHRT